ncbi:hypothetical protein [Jeongeupia naejangsanensis]|uniref:Uncharacterized protein n=1 Tax=Jeongeupia naejangsanensis TaxID=613195 RepID=A0ABS2BJA1_9NEIS|nr:hypothetical protein [Jeongeupia naejangsanensis]MBM3115681.1 hypothetical protein [Jeongeupia naejangsanensis]
MSAPILTEPSRFARLTARLPLPLPRRTLATRRRQALTEQCAALITLDRHLVASWSDLENTARQLRSIASRTLRSPTAAVRKASAKMLRISAHDLAHGTIRNDVRALIRCTCPGAPTGQYYRDILAFNTDRTMPTRSAAVQDECSGSHASHRDGADVVKANPREPITPTLHQTARKANSRLKNAGMLPPTLPVLDV